MDVAEDPAQTRLVEPHLLRHPDGVQPEIEALAVVKRKHVVEHAVVVGKADRCADADDEHTRKETEVALIEDYRSIAARSIRAGRVEPDDRLRLGMAGGADDAVQIK